MSLDFGAKYLQVMVFEMLQKVWGAFLNATVIVMQSIRSLQVPGQGSLETG